MPVIPSVSAPCGCPSHSEFVGVVTEDSPSVEWSGAGTSGSKLVADLKLSPDAPLVVTDDGLDVSLSEETGNKLVISDEDGGLFVGSDEVLLESPGGTIYRLIVEDDGDLDTEEVTV